MKSKKKVVSQQDSDRIESQQAETIKESEEGSEEEQKRDTESDNGEMRRVEREMWGRLDSPEKIQKIWPGEGGRLLIRVAWKQKEEGPRLLATTYGLEQYPPEGYKLLMEYLVRKYTKSMRWA